MPEYATKDDVQEIVSTAVNTAVDDLSEIIQSFIKNVDDRFNVVEQKVDIGFDKIESDVADLKSDVANLNTKYNHLITTLDAFLKRLDDIEIDNTARDAQLARLERWIEQVAVKAGVKLEY